MATEMDSRSCQSEFVGHGIGTQLHEEPQVPNFIDKRNENPRLKPGMVLAVEPMVAAGKPATKVLKDKWTAVTKDGSEFGSLRALHRGNGKRAVGAHAAVIGTVVEELPQAIFAVRLDTQQRVLAHLAGMVERNFVRLVPGDRVEVALAPNDPGRGKILRKLS